MVVGIREATKPLRLANSCFGIAPFDYKKFHVNYVYMLINWAVYCWVISRIQVYLAERIVNNANLELLMWYIPAAIVFIAVFENTYYKKDLEKYFKTLSTVDETLKSLGVSMEYRAVYKQCLITLLVIILFWTTHTVMNFTALIIIMPSDTVIRLQAAIGYSPFIMYINDMYYWTLLRCVESRFDRINRLIEGISRDRENRKRSFSNRSRLLLDPGKFTDMRNDECKVWTLMCNHLQLSKTSRELNRAFGLHMTLQMGFYFCQMLRTISFSYEVCMSNLDITAKAQMLSAQIMWGMKGLIKVALINIICESLRKKSSDTKVALHKFINTLDDNESREEMKQFVMQVYLRPLRLSALGLFDFGYRCFYAMFAVIGEIVILILQTQGVFPHSLTRLLNSSYVVTNNRP